MTQKTVVYFPNNSTLSSIFQFCDYLFSIPIENKILIDFSTMGRVEPFCLVYLSKILRDIIKRNVYKMIWCQNHYNQDYASHMGFFKSFNLDHGKMPGEAMGSHTYLPITCLTIEELQQEATQEWQPVQEIIERRAQKLSERLSQQSNSNLVETLTFSIREIMRNVLEHSGSENIWYCAQYWPRYDKAEITLLDEGIGVQQSIITNPFLEVKNDSDAIQQAIMPGISSKSYKGIRVDRNNPWQNSGYGLYMTSRLCRNGGGIYIGSGTHGILLDERGKTHFNLNHYCQGTTIKMDLSLSKLSQLQTQLATYRTEGYQIASQIEGIGYYSASAASLMLSKDFK